MAHTISLPVYVLVVGTPAGPHMLFALCSEEDGPGVVLDDDPETSVRSAQRVQTIPTCGHCGRLGAVRVKTPQQFAQLREEALARGIPGVYRHFGREADGGEPCPFVRWDDVHLARIGYG
jgi:hypothetical protein